MILWVFRHRKRLALAIVLQSALALFISFFHSPLLTKITLVYGGYTVLTTVVIGQLFHRGRTLISCSANYLDFSAEASNESNNTVSIAYWILAFYSVIAGIVLFSFWPVALAASAASAGHLSYDFYVSEGFLEKRKSGRLVFRMMKLSANELELVKKFFGIYGQKFTMKENPETDLR